MTNMFNLKDDDGNIYIFKKVNETDYKLVEERYNNNTIKSVLIDDLSINDKYVKYDKNGKKLPFNLKQNEECEYYEDTGNIKKTIVNISNNRCKFINGLYKYVEDEYIDVKTYYNNINNTIKSYTRYDLYTNKEISNIQYNENGRCTNKQYY
jgi:hypothetical protein